jgi:hypothetical protein
VLKLGESLYATLSQASLVEERAGQGHFVARNAGVSVPIGSLGGHAIRYRVGATRGHYVSAPPVPTAIDTGTVYVTDRRVVFTGSKQTRECAYAKLLSTKLQPGRHVHARGVEQTEADGRPLRLVTEWLVRVPAGLGARPLPGSRGAVRGPAPERAG